MELSCALIKSPNASALIPHPHVFVSSMRSLCEHSTMLMCMSKFYGQKRRNARLRRSTDVRKQEIHEKG
ncbi:hypothetical protein H5410_048491 [Solanum commersonii]|uniref:Uncharacterized protein n=1 Tax=Solanum commersonii TaxID=4109 RepID=A0A9J5XI88_SOLCO|nr:hypothetical protein H5410_048491 [Solanum commersonii]